ncbi:MAG TPA: ATP-binding cassette domain-containing protein [Candidatus Lustribacter sp.]|nr:ATP-binding cassette domain-containing protein [Candidatus Lustribacter sp.]
MPPAAPLIELRHVNVTLQGQRALEDVSWQLNPGEHWAFVGANGSGKSTLLRVIRGQQWIDPDGGERAYGFDGVPGGPMTAAAQIGFVAPEQQERYVRLNLPIDGRSVIASGFDDTLYLHGALSAERSAAVEAIIDRLDIGAFARRRVRSLSFGQLRRLLIARALVRRPRILVLDEFTNGLDGGARRDILALLGTLAPEVQLILASHRFDDFVPAITHHATLRGGRIVERNTGRPQPPARAARAPRNAAARDRSAAPPIVELRHADVFRGTTHVLHNIDWSIRAGEHTAITGANGSGKSTFASVVAGTLAPVYGGDVLRLGASGPFDVWHLKETIAHVSEEWQVAFEVNHSVEEVVLSGFASSVGLFHEPDAAQRKRAAALIDELGLAPLRARPFMQLSFGERRKVLIARSLVRPPALFILDEVWNGLDASFRTLLEAQIARLAGGGTTLLLIAHHQDDLPALIERRYALDAGRLHRMR